MHEESCGDLGSTLYLLFEERLTFYQLQGSQAFVHVLEMFKELLLPIILREAQNIQVVGILPRGKALSK